jgi:hypothetical protein
MCDISYKQTLFLLTFVGLLLTLTPSTQADETNFVPLNSNHKASKDTGYLILDLELERTVSEILFEPMENRFSNRKQSFGPFAKGKHYVVVALPKGSYQLVAVSAPHYDLPFRYRFKKDRSALQFTIVPKKTGYFAQIFVGEERHSKGYELRIRNRLSSAYPALSSALSVQLKKYPLFFSGVNGDPFFQELQP